MQWAKTRVAGKFCAFPLTGEAGSPSERDGVLWALQLKVNHLGLPWWSSGWVSACQCRGGKVWSLVQEDPTCCGAAKPMSHGDWACASEPRNGNYWAPVLVKPSSPRAQLLNKRSHRNEKPLITTTRESLRSNKDPVNTHTHDSAQPKKNL